ncbi:hypothetical protein HUG17_8597 [Dermatophagoides farinae]|uniref:Uncharacterized protein n=1 Tax=Dermatophagoides farinae TaxID=6954 RepID=A0A9D4SDA7_DERFA|nr:uncharacterized protein LOC124497186 [Dermatophagoides farinae]KAH7637493.1 hypothetical protein HUG17_8597 [Dermatophagoides farinae]
MLLRIDSFFYYQFKEIIECRHHRWYKIKHGGEILSLSIWVLRMLSGVISYKISNGHNDDDDVDQNQYWRMDPFCYYRYVSNPRFFFHALMFILMITLLGIVGKITFFFCSTDSPTFSSPYEYLIINLEQYRQCRRPQHEIATIKRQIFKKNWNKLGENRFIPNIVRKMLTLLLTKYRMIIDKVTIELDPYKWSKLKRVDVKQTIMPDDRLKVIKFLSFVDPIICFVHICLIPPALFIIIDYNVKIITAVDEHHYNIMYRLLFAIDSIILVHNIIVVIQCALFFVILSSGCTLLNYSLILRINRLLQNLAQYCRSMKNNHMKRKYRLLPLPQRQQLARIYREHGEICNDYMNSYRELWSKALLFYLVLSVPFDAIGLSAYWLENLIWIDLATVNLILSIHALITFFSLLDLAKQTKAMHQTGDYFPIILYSIDLLPFNDYSSLSLKLKMDDLYDRLKYGKNMVREYRYLDPLHINLY